MTTSLREVLVAKLAHARALLENLARQGESGSTALEWQKGYAKALEEVLGLEGFSQRSYPRRATAISAEITRIPPAEGVPEQSGEAAIMDLSAGGCHLVTAMELSPGESIALTFALPVGSAVVAVQGRVRRTERRAEQLWVGVEFGGLPEGIVEVIQAFCVPPQQRS
ncbi:MAG: PilZ domain-containing protein [Candidatus Methylomirabilia bacterium]